MPGDSLNQDNKLVRAHKLSGAKIVADPERSDSELQLNADSILFVPDYGDSTPVPKLNAFRLHANSMSLGGGESLQTRASVNPSPFLNPITKTKLTPQMMEWSGASVDRSSSQAYDNL